MYKQNMSQEFLPLCDGLFNVISLASYFCDVVFDVISIYTFYEQELYVYFAFCLSCILLSLLLSQLLSFKWYMQTDGAKSPKRNCWDHSLVVFSHTLMFGVLWRYFRLFVPVDLGRVKTDVRDLCILRLVHAFCEAVPILLVQLYLIFIKQDIHQITDLNIVSSVLSLFSICWALASFSKNLRSKNIHKLVLTWLGVLCQLGWRLGTVTSRILVLAVYASVYHHWILLVVILHWVTMLLWMVAPKGIFHQDKVNLVKKYFYSSLVSWVYVVCYINIQEVHPKWKLVLFYVTMFLENTLLLAVWLGGTYKRLSSFHYILLVIIYSSFFLGIIFMLVYYRFFHVKNLKQKSINCQSNGKVRCSYCYQGNCKLHEKKNSVYYIGSDVDVSNMFCSKRDRQHIQGVFNCRLNPAFKKKKKKPSTFIPPPRPVVMSSGGGGRMLNAFWRRNSGMANHSMSNGDVGSVWLQSSDAEGSVGSRFNIQQKLAEKKQAQLHELRTIEEEIRSGKLQRPTPSRVLHQPIPHKKIQPYFDSTHNKFHELIYHRYPSLMTSYYHDYDDLTWKYGPNYNPSPDEVSESTYMGANFALKSDNRDKLIYKSYRIPSDIESQFSLPRSFTLPREFRYRRKTKSRKMIKAEYFLPSTNSSDGDVDSGDENDEIRNSCLLWNNISNSNFGFRGNVFSRDHQHETKL